MNIPDSFTINTQKVSILIKEVADDRGVFGKFNPFTNTISIYTSVRDDDNNLVVLTNEQKINTFFHEVIHAWQWYSGHDSSEIECSTFASYMIEFLRSTALDNISD